MLHNKYIIEITSLILNVLIVFTYWLLSKLLFEDSLLPLYFSLRLIIVFVFLICEGIFRDFLLSLSMRSSNAFLECLTYFEIIRRSFGALVQLTFYYFICIFINSVKEKFAEKHIYVHLEKQPKSMLWFSRQTGFPKWIVHWNPFLMHALANVFARKNIAPRKSGNSGAAIRRVENYTWAASWMNKYLGTCFILLMFILLNHLIVIRAQPLSPSNLFHEFEMICYSTFIPFRATVRLSEGANFVSCGFWPRETRKCLKLVRSSTGRDYRIYDCQTLQGISLSDKYWNTFDASAKLKSVKYTNTHYYGCPWLGRLQQSFSS